MKYTFQHFIDVSTSATSMTMIKIQAGGQYLMERTKHLWPAFKYMKMGKVSVKCLPASTLPVDPLGLSYEDTDPQTVDPRDQMNPGLVRITNGEDVLDDFTGIDPGIQDQMYYNTMLDPRWSKFMLQSGFKRSAVPLYWNVGQLAQDAYPGSVTNYPVLNSGNPRQILNTGSEHLSSGAAASTAAIPNDSDPRGLFQVGHRGRMGWIPTDALQSVAYYQGAGTGNVKSETPMVNTMPAINVITCLFPRAHKTIYYYRLFITETVYFAGIKNTGIASGDSLMEYRAIDNFVYANPGIGLGPNVGRQNSAYPNNPDTPNDGRD